MKRTKWFRVVLAALIAVFLAIFAVGGMGITAYAAQDSLPGDSLFAVKTGMEQARVALTRNAVAKARLNLQYADLRLDEMLQLAEQGRYQDLEAALAEFQASTGRAIDALGGISLANDQFQAEEMTALVAGIMTRQTLAMNQLVSTLPEQARPVLQDSLTTFAKTSQMLDSQSQSQSSGSGLQYQGTVESITDSAWVIDGVSYAVDGMTIIEGSIQVGDPVEFYVFTASDGTQTLWKVELSSSTDTSGMMDDDQDHPEQEDEMDDDSMDDQESQGTVEAMSADSWTIDGVTYLLDANIMIDGTIQVGDWVEFHTYTAADGTFVLASIEIKSQDDSMDENMDDSYDDDANEQGMAEYEDDSQDSGIYTDDDHEYNSQPANNGSYDDSADDNSSGQYYEDDHEDDHNYNSGSGDHSGDHEDDDHSGGDDHEDHDD